MINLPTLHLIEIGLLLLSLLIICLQGRIIIRSKRTRVQHLDTASSWMLDLLESMPNMVVIFDSSCRIMEIINPKLHSRYGLSGEELVGKPLDVLGEIEVAFKDVIYIVREKIQDTITHKRTNDFTLELTINGKKFYTNARTAPFGKNDAIYYSHDVTSQIAAEKEISRLKTFLQSVVDNLPVGVMVKNACDDFKYYFYNNRLLEMYDDRIIKLGITDFESNEPCPEQSREEDIQAQFSKIPITFERMFYDKETGQVNRWANATKTNFTDEDGNCFIITTIADTTEIKEKQAELEYMRHHLSLALEVGNMGAGTFDIKSRRFSSFFKQLIAKEGMHYDEIIQTVHPNDRPLYHDIFNSLQTGQRDKRSGRIRFLINDTYVWYEIFVMSIKDEEGNVYQLLGTEHNVNEEVEKQIELQEAKSKLELAFKSAEIAPWEFDAQSHLFSSIYPDIFESQGLTIQEYAHCLAEEDTPLFLTGMNHLLDSKDQSMSIQARITFPGQPQQRWYEIHAVVSQWDEEGKVSRIIGLRRDITALKITNELIELRNKAEESNRLKSAFLANMSHEIRTPLNAIVGFSNLIMESTEQNEELKEYFSIIERNNDLLLQLINDILDLSKIEAGQLDFHFSDFEVSAIFSNLKQVYENRLQPGVVLICDLPDTRCLIHSELNRLTQVVSNFLSNAAKFTSHGSITIGYNYTANGLRFFVRDTGKGIAPENVDAVFKRFAKFDSFVPGTGLGLSICETIIQYLGGEIGVESELCKGSEFWFTLPCKPAFITPLAEVITYN